MTKLSSNPKVSVIMSVYNAEQTLREAIDSILKQTYTNWEFVICDDCSSDGSYAIMQEYEVKYPGKFILLHNTENKRLSHSLNRCLKCASGELIARMDADDISVESRFEKQVDYLLSHPESMVVGTTMRRFDSNGLHDVVKIPEYPDKNLLKKGVPFCHATIMMRKEAYDAVKGYTEKKRLLRVEDYHLWIKMYEVGYRGKNIPKQLYLMRDDKAAYKRRKFRYRVNEAYVRGMAVRKLGLPISGYLYAIQPIIIGILPKVVYDYFHKRKLESNSKKNNVCKNK